MISRSLPFVLSSVVLLSGSAVAAVATFQQTTGYSTGAVTIRNDQLNGNINGNAQVIVGNTSTIILRGLFEFDLSQIETLAGGNAFTIDSVTLTLTTSTQAGSGNTSSQFNLNVLGSNSDFDEATVTWNSAPTAAGGTLGTSLGSLSFVPATAEATRVFANTSEFSAAATSALAGTDNTLRLIVTANNEAGGYLVRFNTNEHATESLRPLLTVNYTVVPEPTSFVLSLAGVTGLLICRKRR